DREQASVQSATSAAKPVRRLPVQKDWPAWALISAQIGILIGALSFWEIGVRAGWIDAFFWSQPSAIAHTMAGRSRGRSRTPWRSSSPARRRLDGYQLHFPLDHFWLSPRHHGGIAARAIVLVVAQLRGDRAALRHLPGDDPKTRPRPAHHPGVRDRARLEGGGGDRADAGRVDAHRAWRRKGARPGRREAVLFARRLAPAGVP